jgi:hypothetical protein
MVLPSSARRTRACPRSGKYAARDRNRYERIPNSPTRHGRENPAVSVPYRPRPTVGMERRAINSHSPARRRLPAACGFAATTHHSALTRSMLRRARDTTGKLTERT